MNTLTQEQIDEIKSYWNQRKKLENEISILHINMEQCYAEKCDIEYDSDTEYDPIEDHEQKIDARIDELNKEIKEFEQIITLLDQEYEITINGYGLSLYDRNMDEELFTFINDGFE